MRVLGIDPGLQTTGFGLVDVEGAHLHYVASGTIRTRDAAQGDLPGRLDAPDSPSFFLSVFKVRADEAAIAVASDDAASVGWYSAEEIANLPAPDSVRECIARLEAERARRSA